MKQKVDSKFNQDIAAAQKAIVAGEFRDGLAILKRYSGLARQLPDAAILQGWALERLGRFEEAKRVFRSVIRAHPTSGKAYYLFSGILGERNEYLQAVSVNEEWVKACPESSAAYISLAGSLWQAGLLDRALASCLKAIRLDPQSPQAHMQAGIIENDRQAYQAAIDYFKTAIDLAPNDPDNIGKALMSVSFSPILSQKECSEWHRRWGDLFGDVPLLKFDMWNRDPDRRIRLAFVGGDFYNHPVARFLFPLISEIDRTKFEIIIFSNSVVTDGVTDQMRPMCDAWHSVAGLESDLAAEKIYHERVDILVDLAGHTRGNLLNAMAKRLAPVQASWLGYWDTTGMPTIDYYLTDAYHIRPGEQKFALETVVWLESRHCFTVPSEAPEICEPPHIKNGYITLGSFNRVGKITPLAIELWARCLRAFPGSRFVFKGVGFDDPEMNKRIVSLFASHGISEDRIDFRGRSSYAQLLREYGDLDIAVDTFPYSGGATTCDALFMGVPVVTLSLDRFAARQGDGYVNLIGLPDLVTSTPDAYVEKIISLGRDSNRLSELRKVLRRRMTGSPLCNSKRFASNLQAAFEGIWRRWCAQILIAGDDPRFDAARAAWELGNYRRFIALLKSVSDLPLRDMDLGLQFATAHLYVGEIDTGRAMLADCINRGELRTRPIKLARLLVESGLYSEATKLLDLWLIRSPDDLEVRVVRAEFAAETGAVDEATAGAESVLQADPSNVRALCVIAMAAQEQFQHQAALDAYDRAIAIEPENPALLQARLALMSWSPVVRQSESAAAHRKWGSFYAEVPGFAFENRSTDPHRKLRIGYVSADFRQHPVVMLFFHAWQNADRDRYSLIAFDNTKRGDVVSDQLRIIFDEMHNVVGLDDKELARLIYSRQIDILVDLSGHSSGTRITAFAGRPAPVQVSAVGYWDTTGLAQIDYVLTDPNHVPVEAEPWFVETIARIPTRHCITIPEKCPVVSETPVLDRGYVAFGSFNRLKKLTVDVVDLWASILHEVPNSRLFLKAARIDIEGTADWYAAVFAERGISAERLVLRGRSTYLQMLKEYADVDIALDPWPFSGGASSCDALLMGVPIVTLPTERLVSRQTAGYLAQVGLPDLIAGSPDDYRRIAVSLASDPSRLAAIRREIRPRLLASPLADGVAFAASVEAAYREMWRRWSVQQSKGA